MTMTEASAHTVATESKILEAVKAEGVAFATQAEARRLVKRGLIERISGKGHGAGNTPVWAATAAFKATWAAEATEGCRTVRCLGGEWPVVEEREGAVVILRNGTRTVVPTSILA